MRGFFIGLLLVVGVAVTLLSLRPGGLRRQLRFAARRFRLFLLLGGAYVLTAGAVRVVFTTGPVVDYGPPALAVFLGALFVILAQDPKAEGQRSPGGPRAGG